LPGLSILWGYLADRLGRRVFVALGATGAISFALLPTFYKPMQFALVASYASLAWGLGWPAVVAMFMDTPESYSKVMAFTSAGYALGSGSMGIAFGLLKLRAFELASVCYLAAYILFYAFYEDPSRSQRASVRDFVWLLKSMSWLAVSLVMASFAIELGFASMAVRLRGLVGAGGALLYGLFFGTLPLAFSVPARLCIAYVLKHVDPRPLLALTLSLYSAYHIGLYCLGGLPLLVLWLLPIYAMYDSSAYASAQRYAYTNLRASASSVVLTSQCIGGGLLAILSGKLSSLGMLNLLMASIILGVSAVVCSAFALRTSKPLNLSSNNTISYSEV